MSPPTLGEGRSSFPATFWVVRAQENPAKAGFLCFNLKNVRSQYAIPIKMLQKTYDRGKSAAKYDHCGVFNFVLKSQRIWAHSSVG